MYTIIIEKSHDQMQVASIFPPKYFGDDQHVRSIATELHSTKHLLDYDVLFFPAIEDLNEFLLENVKTYK